MNREQTYKLFGWAYSRLTKIEKINEEVLPKEGPFILVLNHMSRIDFPALVAINRNKDVYALAADKYKNFPIFGYLIASAGMIFIDRSQADFQAMKKAFAVLKDGNILALSPEGTRSRNAQLLEAKEGVVMLATKANVPIYTVSITGTEHFMDEFKHFRKPHIVMRFGPGFELTLDREDRKNSLRKAADEVMCHIAAMLPESYRGFYKDHPRVQELLSEWKAEGKLSLPE